MKALGNMMTYRRWLVMVVFAWLTTQALAQDLTQHNWYFGNSASAIRFSRSDNSAALVSNQKTPFGTGGSAVATNPIDANLIFYTDGSRVYDISSQLIPMTNGTGLNGNTSGNQPVAICPVPGVATQYYIFTNSASGISGGSVLFSIVDLTLVGNSEFLSPPTGEVTLKNQSLGFAANSRSEAMIVIPHDNGTDYWLITHENGTDNYTVTHVQPIVGTFTNTTFPNLTGGLDISASNFSYHATTGRIAVSPFTNNRNVTILNFDNATGILSLDQFILNSAGVTDGAVYDTEWSPNGRFLYISRLNDSGTDAQVLQFDFTNPTTTLTPVLPAPVFRSYGIQLAPDTTMYHLYQAVNGGPFLVGQFTDTDSLASLITYNPIAFTGNPNFAATQFPSFAPSPEINLAVSFTTAGTCSNSPISFYPTVTPAADSLVWSFGDGSGTSDWSPIYTYPNGGTFNVTVRAYLNGDSAVFSSPITLTDFQLQINVVQDTTACECELPVNNGVPPCPNDTSDDIQITADITGGTPVSVLWSNGDVGPVLTPDSAGYYYLVVTDATGCVAYAGVNVREYGLQDQRANVWYFGQNAGIDFNETPSIPLNGPINSPEGVAVISDRNGKVILSTDGQRVFDRNDVEITPAPMPPGVGGEPGATQAAIIIPVPGDETLYYIFTTQEVHGGGTYEVRYSLFDLKLRNGDGDIVEYNQLLFTRSTERLTGNGNWLIIHEYGNNSFRAYPITGTGIGNPVITSIGSDHVLSAAETGQGYMKLGPNNVLAVTLSIPGVSNVIELFDFDNATGELSNFRTANLNTTAGQVYGVEFVGNKIFATLKGSPSAILEFYIDYQGNPVLIVPPQPNVPHELGALQIGPDGQLYVAVNNRAFLGTININPDTLQTSTFVLDGYALAGGTQSTLGLPNFIQNVGNAIQPAGMLVTGFCLGDSTLFQGFGTDPIDEFEWSFGDGFGDTQAVTSHIYAVAGDYIVTLRVFNRCGLDTLITQNITIFPPPANPTFLPAGVLQPVICNGDLTLEATPPPDQPNLLYLWSTGETTRQIIVSQQSIVNVTITDNISGCTSFGSILVADNRPPVDLGPDLTLCQNTPVFPLNALNPNANHTWTINGTPAGTAQVQPVDSSVPGIFEYKVQVTDPLTTCTNRDSVTYTFNESPAFTAVPVPPSACGANDGQITLNILSPASTLFSYTVSGPSTAQGIDQSTGVVVNPNLTTLVAGSYGVVVIDQVSGCATINVVSVNDNVFLINSVVRQNACDPVNLVVSHTAVNPFTYRVIDNTTAQLVTSIGAPISVSPFTIPNINQGNYTVEMTSLGCVVGAPATVVADPSVSITGFTVNPCVNPITVGVNGGTGWAWTGPDIQGSAALQTITATPPQGNQIFNVTVSQAGFCPLDTTVTVFVNNNVTVDFSQTDACADQVTLTAATTPAGGNFTYLWYRSTAPATPIVGGQNFLVGLADNGQSYRVEVINAASGCVFSSAPPKQVFIAGNLVLNMTSTPPCIGLPFTLTATSTLGGTNFQWAVDGDNISGATSSTLTRTTEGLYRVTGTVPGCSKFVENQIILRPSTPGSLPQRALICNNPANPDPNTREILLDAGAGFTSYQWYQGGVLLPAETSQTLLATEPGVFQVDLLNNFGCASADLVDVIEECRPRIVAPTAFRPGSSVEPNKEFSILSFFIDDTGFQVFIFNRWGELVFQSNDRLFTWNGGYNNSIGQLLPSGTYTYIVKYKSAYRPEDGTQEKRGGVVLLR